MLKKLYINVVAFILAHFNLSIKLRNIFIWPIASRVLGTQYNSVIKLHAGFSLHAYMDDHLGRLAIFYGTTYPYFWEPTTTRLLEKIVTEAKHIIVAGSHIGLMVLYARKAMTTEGALVYTFEPILNLNLLAEKNISLNHLSASIRLEKKALSDEDGFATMQIDRIRSKIIDSQNITSKDIENVPVITIDTYCIKENITSLDLVLLDIEGHEFKALQGMKEQLRTNPPKDIIYEISFPKKDNLETSTKIEAFLKEFGYSFYIIEDVYDPVFLENKIPPIQLTKCTPETYEDHRNNRYFNVYATLRSPIELESF